ncbi:MAG: 7-carboxy-7-deazaguanine synthase QueE, partial [Muribaculaceae bacterium]
MSDEEIVAEVGRYPQARIVVLTGGEPSLHIDAALVAKLKQATGKIITIETNGTRVLPEGIDWVTLSPKTGFEGGDLQPVVLEECDELKVVYQGQDVEQIAALLPAPRLFLQPCSGINVRETVDYCLAHPRWRLSLQSHKYIDIK